MSNDTSEVVAAITAAIAAEAEIYYYLYKLGVYENLFVGIVYGEGQGACRCSLYFLSHSSLHYRRLYRTLRHLGLRPLVRLPSTR